MTIKPISAQAYSLCFLLYCLPGNVDIRLFYQMLCYFISLLYNGESVFENFLHFNHLCCEGVSAATVAGKVSKLDSYVRDPIFLRGTLTLVSDSGSFHQQITATRGSVVQMLKRNICMTSLLPNCNCKCKVSFVGLHISKSSFQWINQFEFDDALKCWQYL